MASDQHQERFDLAYEREHLDWLKTLKASDMDGISARNIVLRYARLFEQFDALLKVAEGLFQMIDRETWRAHGGDDQQGHYEGDYRAAQIEEYLVGLRASNPHIERAGWMATHPLTDQDVEVVTMEWFREVRLERDVLLNAAQTVLINGADGYSLDALQAAINHCRPRKSDAEIRAAIIEAVGRLS